MASPLLLGGGRTSVALTPLGSLDLAFLIRALSEPANLPESFHIRNRLLHAFLVDPAFSHVRNNRRRQGGRNRGGGALLRNAWETVWDKNGVLEGWAVGAVPAGLIKHDDPIENDGTATASVEGEHGTGVEKASGSPWGILLLSGQADRANLPVMGAGDGVAPLRPEAVPQDPHRRSETPRLDLWLSQACVPHSPTASMATEVLETVVPRLLQKHQNIPTDQDPNGAQQGDKLKVLCCSFEESLAALVRGRAQAEPRRVMITFDNPCIRYLGSSDSQPHFITTQQADRSAEDDESETKGEFFYCLSPPWRLGSLNKEESEVIEEVMRTNKIPFPKHYVESHAHISSAVFCDDDGNDEASRKRPVGWAYFHSDLAIASLFVKPEYRRRKVAASLKSLDDDDDDDKIEHRRDAGGPGSLWGVGTVVVANMSHKLAQAQTAILDALRLGEVICACVGDDVERAEGYRSNPKHGYGIGPCDVVGETEVGNSSARKFMEQGAGFRPGGVTAWMQVELAIPISQ